MFKFVSCATCLGYGKNVCNDQSELPLNVRFVYRDLRSTSIRARLPSPAANFRR